MTAHSPTVRLAPPAQSADRRTGLDPSPIARVVLVDSMAVVRTALGRLIEDETAMRVVAQSGSASEALDVIRSLAIRTGLVTLVSIPLTGRPDAFWLIRAIRSEFPATRIMAIGANVEEALVARALFFGADGFLDKSSSARSFLKGLTDSSRGKVVLAGLPPERLGAVAEGIRNHRFETRRLTVRELEVISAAADGLTARQIARRLSVRERTVTTHLSRIYTKLGVSNRIAALAAVGRAGLLDSDTGE
jgi:DNA-binding NarL/FixJ family response regulator